MGSAEGADGSVRASAINLLVSLRGCGKTGDKERLKFGVGVNRRACGISLHLCICKCKYPLSSIGAVAGRTYSGIQNKHTFIDSVFHLKCALIFIKE